MLDLPDWARPLIIVVGALIAHAGGVGFDWVSAGDPDILLEGLPVARVNDPTGH